MHKRLKIIISFLLFVGMIIVIFNINMVYSFDTEIYRPTPPSDVAVISDISDKIIGILQVAGSLVSVIALILIGIKYMVGSTEEKAEYKETLIPYFIGAILVFGISNFIGYIKSISNSLSGSNGLENAGQQVITILATAGSVISVIVLVILGIKYMLGSTEEKAEYKSSLMPYTIGAALVFAASSLAGVVYQFAIGL